MRIKTKEEKRRGVKTVMMYDLTDHSLSPASFSYIATLVKLAMARLVYNDNGGRFTTKICRMKQ